MRIVLEGKSFHAYRTESEEQIRSLPSLPKDCSVASSQGGKRALASEKRGGKGRDRPGRARRRR
ncbi:unnamed protein product, partial [Ixodes pacificus]